jgi:hypothetical protein
MAIVISGLLVGFSTSVSALLIVGHLNIVPSIVLMFWLLMFLSIALGTDISFRIPEAGIVEVAPDDLYSPLFAFTICATIASFPLGIASLFIFY